MSLFPKSKTANNNFVEFRAGRLKLEGKTVTPLPEKGLIYLSLTDSLLQFCWKNRDTGKIEEEFVIIESEPTVFRKVKQSKDRVYLLEFKSSGQKMFYWMQESEESKDDLNCKKVNHLLKNTPVPGTDPFATMDTAEMEVDSETAKEAPATADSSKTDQDKQKEAISKLLSDLQKGPLMGPPTTLAAPSNQIPTDNVDLGDVLSPTAVSSLLESEDVVNRLAEHLPEGVPKTKAGITELMGSPQFTQAVQVLNAAIKSGSVFPQTLGVNGESDGKFGVEGFLQALQNEIKKKEEK